MYKYELFPAAQDERFEAVRFYEDRQKGLGFAFFDEFEGMLSFICENPKMCPVDVLDIDVRRAVLSRFPYNIYYRVHGGIIQVIAVSHQKRRPQYWKDRLSSN